ncbi:hypothetical protein [Victivallis lenta]|uniref:hypothetical protein n=1 Tax=Victivallis lenta TaxID=2606640 RepID=UPI0012B3E8E6|nr:hypothetical protein [Victivallis lenta]
MAAESPDRQFPHSGSPERETGIRLNYFVPDVGRGVCSCLAGFIMQKPAVRPAS